MNEDKQIKKIIEYSISELKKDSELLKRGLSEISLLKEDPHSLKEFEQNMEEEIINLLCSDGNLPKEQAIKVMVVIRGYVLQGLWSKSGGWTFEQSIDHASGSLAPDLKKSFEESLRGLIMNTLYCLESKGFIKKLQKYFVYLAYKKGHLELDSSVKILDAEYQALDNELKNSADIILSKK